MWSEALDRLNKKAVQKMADGDMATARRLTEASNALKGWMGKGQHGLPPPSVLKEVAEMDEEAEPKAEEQVVEPAISAQQITPLATPPIVATVFGDDGEDALKAMMDGADGKLWNKDYLGALSDYKQVEQITHSETLRAKAAQSVRDAEKQFGEEVTRRKTAAQTVARRQGGNLVERRRAWMLVKEIAPDDTDVIRALEYLDQVEGQKKWKAELDKLESPLQESKKSLRDVENVRDRAEAWLASNEIQDAESAKRLKGIYDKLTALRADMQLASEGGASNERSKNFKAAIEKYKEALNKGYQVIQDDSGEGVGPNGEPGYIEVVPALARVRRAYWQDLKGRVMTRVEAANKFLADGYPETAVTRLEEAQKLINDIEEGAEDVRPQVDEALTKANEELSNKQKAQDLANQAEIDPDPEKARAMLLDAKVKYPKLHDLDSRIKNKEEAVVIRVSHQMAADISDARGRLGLARGSDSMDTVSAKLKEAREHCRMALDRGSNLTLSNDERDKRRQETHTLLNQIDESESALTFVLAQLKDIDGAIAKKDARLANLLISDLEGDGRWRILNPNFAAQSDPRISMRKTRIAGLQGDDKIFQEAVRLFGEGSYQQAAQEAGALSVKSVEYRNLAQALATRALARVNLSEARNKYITSTSFDESIALVNRVIENRDKLPPEDLPLVAEAERMRAQLNYFHPLFNTLFSMRRKSDCDWEAWFVAIDKLRVDPQISEKDPSAIYLKDGLLNWLRDKADQEYVNGVKDLVDAAFERAKELRSQPSEAFKTLELPAQRGLIRENDPRWREVQYAYYVLRRGNPSEKDGRESLKQAADAALKALQTAPDNKVAEARRAFIEASRESVLAEAQSIATGAGGNSALEFIESRIEEMPDLGQDAKVRARLIRYAIEKGDFNRALEHAHTVAFIPDEEKYASVWEQLVIVLKTLAENKLSVAVNGLCDVRAHGQLDKSKSYAGDLEEYARQRVETRLRLMANPNAVSYTNKQLVDRVQALSLQKRLNEGDLKLSDEIRALSGQLAKLVGPLRDRANDLRLTDSLMDSLQTGQELLDDMSAVIEALRLGGQEAQAKQLDGLKQNVQAEVDRWRKGEAALTRLDEQWANAMKGGWWQGTSVEAMDHSYEPLANFPGEVKEMGMWERRLSNLKQSLNGDMQRKIRGLRSILAELKISWNEERFDDFLKLLTEAENRLRDTQNLLDDKRFAIPEVALTMRDLYITPQADVAGFPRLRQRAEEKKINLRQWQTWSSDFSTQMTSAESMSEEIGNQLSAIPPCLSEPKEKLTILLQLLDVLRRKLDSQPSAALSGVTKQQQEEYPRDLLAALFEEQTTSAKGQLLDAETKLKALEPLVRRFTDSKNQNIQSKRVRQDIRKRIDEVFAKDSCNSEARRYDQLLQRFE